MQETRGNETRLRFWDRGLELASIPLCNLFFWRSSQIGLWGVIALVILLIVSGYQITPGREFFDFGWPRAVYFLLVGVLGGLLGLTNAQRRLVGLFAGTIAAAGSLWVVGLLFEAAPQIPANRIWAWLHVVALAVGLVPGVALYAVLDWCLTQASEKEAKAKAKARLERRRREHGLSPDGAVAGGEPAATEGTSNVKPQPHDENR